MTDRSSKTLAELPGDRMPAQLERQFEAILEGPAEDQVRQIQRLARQAPQHAAKLWQWYAIVLRQSGYGPGLPLEIPTSAQPEKLGKYLIRERLGKGGMGEVFLAKHEELGRSVALKIIRPDLVASDQARLRFKREILALSRIENQGICKVYEIGEHGGIPFMVMPLIDGEDLGKAIKRAKSRAEPGKKTRLDLPTPPAGSVHRTHKTSSAHMNIAKFFAACARSLHAAHEAGLVHRDIKPQNIMVTGEGLPVIVDFGLAKDEGMSAGLTATHAFMGTPQYMAPEQISSRMGSVDRRTDVYSLGISLYEALALRTPFVAPSREALLDKVLDTEAPSPSKLNSDVPKDLGTIVLKAIRKAPNARYSSALELAEDLERFLEHRPILARRISPQGRLLRWSRRNPIASLLILSVTVGLSISLSLLSSRDTALAKEKAQLERYQLLRHVVKLRDARKATRDLIPVRPEKIQAMETWLETRAEPLARALAALRENLAGRSASRTSRLDSADELFLQETLAQLLTDLELFFDEKLGDNANIRQRLAWARELEQRTITSQKQLWDAAIAAIAASDGITASKLYAGMSLQPQMGLIPLCMDENSKLWEFAHPRSGQLPVKHRRRRIWMMKEETCLVFVLVPGGSFDIGSQKDSKDLPNYDAHAGDTLPITRLELEPFFISKYEMTQAQWMRLAEKPQGHNPSIMSPTTFKDMGFTLAHPVEGVSWIDCKELLDRYGLLIPTEAQWEYACRAGSTTTWWTGNEAISLQRAANLLDLAMLQLSGQRFPTMVETPELQDGYPYHCPVGRMRPNPFGLHDVHGNVMEQCRDQPGAYGDGLRAGDGLQTKATTQGRLQRGGSSISEPFSMSSAVRSAGAETGTSAATGIRPSRAVLERRHR